MNIQELGPEIGRVITRRNSTLERECLGIYIGAPEWVLEIQEENFWETWTFLDAIRDSVETTLSVSLSRIDANLVAKPSRAVVEPGPLMYAGFMVEMNIAVYKVATDSMSAAVNCLLTQQVEIFQRDDRNWLAAMAGWLYAGITMPSQVATA